MFSILTGFTENKLYDRRIRKYKIISLRYCMFKHNVRSVYVTRTRKNLSRREREKIVLMFTTCQLLLNKRIFYHAYKLFVIIIDGCSGKKLLSSGTSSLINISKFPGFSPLERFSKQRIANAQYARRVNRVSNDYIGQFNNQNGTN